MPTETVRVATLNVCGRSGSWGQRRSVLMDGLREIRPDLVALPLQHLVMRFLFFLRRSERGHFEDGIQAKML